MGNSSDVLGRYLSEHLMGIRGSGFIPTRIGTEPTIDDAPAGRPVRAALPQRHRQASRTSSAAITSRAAAARSEYPGLSRTDIPGFGKAFKSNVRKYYPALLSLGGFGEVLPVKENRVTLDPEVKDAWGVPGAEVRLQVRRQRDEDGQGHGRHRSRRC